MADIAVEDILQESNVDISSFDNDAGDFLEDDQDLNVDGNVVEETGENVQNEQLGQEEDEMELSVEALEQIKRRKKLEKREEKRRKDELLRAAAVPAPVAEEKKSIRIILKEEKEDEDRDRDKDRDVDVDVDVDVHVDVDADVDVDEMEDDEIKQSLLMSGTYDRQLIEELKAESLSSSEDNDIDTRQPCSVSYKDTFLDNFNLPSFSDVSTSSELEEVGSVTEATSVCVEADTEVDVGKFVDPVTGEVRPEESKSAESVVEIIESVEQETESSSTISFDWPFDLEDEIVQPAKPIDDMGIDFDILMDLRGSSRFLPAESTTELEFMRVAREIRQITTDFLFKLFDDVVDACEYVDEKKLLCQNLDMSKLLLEIHRLIRIHLSAKRYNQDLQQKMYEYYRRVGQLRCFQKLAPHIEKTEYLRHREAMMQFDYLRQKISETKKKNSYLISSVNMDMAYQFDIDQRTTQSFEKCIRETLIRKDDEFLPRIVENELRRIQNLRNEISDSRLRLITRQHTLGRLCERKHKFDQITDELTMDQFLATQREVSALGIKVEERNHDLIRMRDRCVKNSHQLAFVKEKITILSARLIEARENLKIRCTVNDELRAHLFNLKVNSVRLKAVNQDMQDKAGILFKPSLLDDFDNTMETVLTKRKKVESLKHILYDLESRIEIIEQNRRSTLMPRATFWRQKFPKGGMKES